MTTKQLELLEEFIDKRIVLHEDFLNSRGKEIVQADIDSLRSQLTEEEKPDLKNLNLKRIRSYCESGCECPTCHLGTSEETKVEECYYCQLRWKDRGQYAPDYDWSPKPKERWKPKYGELFYCLSDDIRVRIQTFGNSPAHDNMVDNGNCFPTQEAAAAAARKVKELLLNL